MTKSILAKSIFVFDQNLVALTLSLTLTLTLTASAALAQEPALNSESLPEWREHILPSGDDLAWQAIPWLTTFAEGIQQANDADRPLLLWVMNGHPFGCT